MNSRRLIRSPRRRGRAALVRILLQKTPGGPLLMSALGHKRTLKGIRLMSALPPKADISWSGTKVGATALLLRPGAIVPMESARY
jgi:hypothetical protein